MTWAKGQSGNPAGGIRKSRNLAEALRRAVSAEDVAAVVAELIKNPDAPVRERAWACQYWADRCEGKAIARVVTASATIPFPVLQGLTPDQRELAIDAYRARVLAQAEIDRNPLPQLMEPDNDQ